MENRSKLGIPSLEENSRQDLIYRFEIHINKLGKKELDLVIKKLNYVCLNFDPYGQEPSIEVDNIMMDYELNEFTSNPFDFTNILLQMLDKTDNLKKSRAH
jgi:hypothetical protein